MWFRYVIALGLILIGIAFVMMILAGCTLVLESRSSAECKPNEGCKAESSLRRDAGKGVVPD